jgi:hypothetical protein
MTSCSIKQPPLKIHYAKWQLILNEYKAPHRPNIHHISHQIFSNHLLALSPSSALCFIIDLNVRKADRQAQEIAGLLPYPLAQIHDRPQDHRQDGSGGAEGPGIGPGEIRGVADRESTVLGRQLEQGRAEHERLTDKLDELAEKNEVVNAQVARMTN